MGRGLEMARSAAERQAKQSVIAVGIAVLTLVTFAPLALLVKAVVAFAAENEVPLGEVPVLAMLIVFVVVSAEELVSGMTRGSLRLGQMLGVIFVQVMAWTVLTAAAKRAGVTDIAAGAVPACVLVFVLSKPVSVLLRPGQARAARLRRTVREIKLIVARISASMPNLTAVLYVYLTVFREQDPVMEVLVMGLAMPVLQAFCMSLMAFTVGQHERLARRAVVGSQRRVSGKDDDAELSEAVKKKEHDSRVELMMVLSSEMLYAAAAFSTLALLESDQAFLLSLVSMLAIEVVQVAVHVKVRRVVSRVVDETTAETLLGDNQCIRDWLLYQELGEKVGLVLVIGFLALDRALGRDVPAVQALDSTRLAYRALAMAVLELVGDIGKAVVSQALGVLPREGDLGCVSMTPFGVLFAITASLAASFAVQIGLALGSS